MTLITDNDQYKLGIEVKRTEHYIHVTLARWMPEMEWIKTDMFLSEAEYLLLCRTLV
jgi:hypothetical protein